MKLTFRDKVWQLKGGLTARAAIEKVGLDPEAVLVVRGEKLITDDVVLEEGDDVKLIAVISGGRRAASATGGLEP